MATLDDVVAARIESEEIERVQKVSDKLMRRAARRDMKRRIDTYSGLSAAEVMEIEDDEWDAFVEVVR